LFTVLFAPSSSQDTAQWQVYQQDQNFAQAEDYLACIMTSSMSLMAYQNQQLTTQVGMP
jgi:hypothetical protein